MFVFFKKQGEVLGNLTKDVENETQEQVRYIGRLDPMAAGLVIYLKKDEKHVAFMNM